MMTPRSSRSISQPRKNIYDNTVEIEVIFHVSESDKAITTVKIDIDRTISEVKELALR